MTPQGIAKDIDPDRQFLLDLGLRFLATPPPVATGGRSYRELIDEEERPSLLNIVEDLQKGVGIALNLGPQTYPGGLLFRFSGQKLGIH